MGQELPDSLQVDIPNHLLPDSLKKPSKYLPTGVRIGMDLISFGQGVETNGVRAITQADVRQWKFSADIDFYRYFLNIEYGIFDRQWDAPNSTYINKGSFLKIGPDVNFLHRDPDQSALFIGMRYAISNYEDNLQYNYSNVFWSDGSDFVDNSSLSSQWFEITTGIKVKLSTYIWMGYTARFQFNVNDNHASNELAPHWIPGYGFAVNESDWGFEYWLIFRIPFREYTPAPKKKK